MSNIMLMKNISIVTWHCFFMANDIINVHTNFISSVNSCGQGSICYCITSWHFCRHDNTPPTEAIFCRFYQHLYYTPFYL